MKLGRLSDFSQKELDHATFIVDDANLESEAYFVLGSLSVPNECSTTIQSINHYINSDAIKTVLVSVMKLHEPKLHDPTFRYVPRAHRQLS